MNPTKIAIIGAGSASFGPTTLATLMREPKLRGSELALVDLNEEALTTVVHVAERMNVAWGADMTIRASTDRRELLPGANFVIVSIEVPPVKSSGVWTGKSPPGTACASPTAKTAAPAASCTPAARFPRS